MSDSERQGVRYSDPDDVRGPLWEEAVAAGATRGALVPAAGEGVAHERGDPFDDDVGDDVESVPEPGNLRRYLRWQARDWVRQRGIALLGVVLAVLLVAWLVYDPAEAERTYHAQLVAQAAAAARTGPRVTWQVFTPQELLQKTFLGWVSFLSLFGSVVATFGIVARERERGLQRFLFAKPMRVGQYYLQKLAVATAGYLAVALVGSLLASLLFHTALPIGAGLAVAAGVYATLGALTFFLSTLTRFDGGIALSATFAAFIAFIVANASAHSVSPAWVAVARAVRWVLPPVATLEAFSPSLTGAPQMSVTFAIVWLVVYAVAAVAAALAVLRRRSIST